MSLLGILFGIVMTFLIGKAILETIWGLILVIYGLLCYALGIALGLFAEFLSVLWKLKRAAQW
jgi:hypothetical protein